METTIEINSSQANGSFTIVIEIPTANFQCTIHQSPTDQLPTYRYSTADVDISCIPCVQTRDAQTGTDIDLKNEIEIKDEIIDIPEPLIIVKEESFDYDEEMDRVLLGQISMISDDEYSLNSESETEHSSISSEDYFGSIDDIFEYLHEAIFD